MTRNDKGKKMNKAPQKKNPVKKVIQYHTVPNGTLGYLVFITYVLYTGNAINDIKRKFQEVIKCDNLEKLKKLESRFDNSAAFMEKRLQTEFRRIGANEFVTKTEIPKLWQR